MRLPLYLRIILVMVLAMIGWMAYFFVFRTDGHGHVLETVGSPAAVVAGQRLLGRADTLAQQGHYEAARALLDSLRDTDDPNVFVKEETLRQQYDSLRMRRYRAQHPQQ